MNKIKSLRTLERVTLTLFLVCMIVTAVMFVSFIWIQPEQETLFMAMGSMFVIGLANFLIWLPVVIYRLIDKLSKK